MCVYWKFSYIKISILLQRDVLDTVYNWNCHLSPGYWQLQERRILTKLKYKQNHATSEPNQRRKSWLLLEYNLIIPWTGCRVLTLNQLNWLRQIWLSSQSQSHDQWSALIGIDNATENNIDIMLNWELWFQNYFILFYMKLKLQESETFQ